MRSTRIPIMLSVCLAVVFAFAWPREANAIPSFARTYEVPCSTCHQSFPLLNETGRVFKDNGYRFSRDEAPPYIISEALKLNESFPIAAIIKTRPYEKTESGSDKIRVLHEIELMLAGMVSEDISVFVEIEGEDDEDTFNLAMAQGWVGYHPLEEVNLLMAYGPLFFNDPYNTLSTRVLDRGRNKIIDNAFGGADNNGKIRSARQIIAMSGRLVPELFYSLAFAAPSGDGSGTDPGTYIGRMVYDIVPELSLGGFAIVGECQTTATNCARDRNFSRYGIDAQAQYGEFRLQGVYLTARDDLDSVGNADNDAWYLEGSYAFQDDGRPLFVPMLRFDTFETANGTENNTNVTLNFGYYLRENVRAFIELFKEVDVPTGDEKDGRITLQAEIGF